MLRANSRNEEFNLDSIISDNDAINNDMISEIEKELQENLYDMKSLVFLLYDVPDTALQRLITYQSTTSPKLLHEWYRSSRHTPTWKHEFVEALLLCQLNSIVRKLGFHVPSTRRHYQTDNIHIKMYIDPVKKALYKLCENMNTENLLKLKMSLQTYEIDTSAYDSCELVLLKLMCNKFICITQHNLNGFGSQVKLNKLLKIIESLPGLQRLAEDIYILQESINAHFQPSAPVAVSTPSLHIKVDESNESRTNPNLFGNDFQDLYTMIDELNLKETTSKNLKSDKTEWGSDCYVIKNPQKLGVCVILNQVHFYPSKDSIDNEACNVSLDTRIGSDRDKAIIERTMSTLNFSVYSATDLDHKLMFVYLEKIIAEKVTSNDSVFMLYILSHGIKGHIYAADSVKISIDDFQNLLDSDLAINLHNIPKLLIVQACQVRKEPPHPTLVADRPGHDTKWKKANCVICWATAPEMKAFRHLTKGSIFIQMLCSMLLEYAKTEHVCDIFTKVIDTVQQICTKNGYEQWPIYATSLKKKLYLQKP